MRSKPRDRPLCAFARGHRAQGRASALARARAVVRARVHEGLQERERNESERKLHVYSLS